MCFYISNYINNDSANQYRLVMKMSFVLIHITGKYRFQTEKYKLKLPM